MSELHGAAIGDLHLDKLRDRFPNHIDLQIASVERALEHCYRRGIQHVFFLGDIGEGKKDFTGKLVMSTEAQVALFRLCLKWGKKLTLHFYTGNHDFSDLGSSTLDLFLELSRSKSIRASFYGAETTLRLNDVTVNILPYPCTKPTRKVAALNFAHYEVAGAMSDSGRTVHSEEKHAYRDQVFIQGHLHTAQKVRNHYYPGTLYQLNFGERLPKGFAEFKYSAHGFKYKWVEQEPPFRMLNVRVTKRSDLKTLQRSPLILYKLFIDESVTIKPSDLDGVTIVNQLTYGSEEEATALEHAEFVMSNQELEFDMGSALNDMLKERGLTKAEIKACKVILDRRLKR